MLTMIVFLVNIHVKPAGEVLKIAIVVDMELNLEKLFTELIILLEELVIVFLVDMNLVKSVYLANYLV